MRQLIYFTILIFSIISCNTKYSNPDFPIVQVNKTIYPGSGAYYDLGAIGGYMFLEGGHKGLLVYRVSTTEFRAYDVSCPNEPTKECEKIELEKTNSFRVVDKCCGSEFLITTGEVLEGPSEYNLHSYNTSFDGNRLNIWN